MLLELLPPLTARREKVGYSLHQFYPWRSYNRKAGICFPP